MPIQWTPMLALGIPELDAQHLELDRQLGLIHDAICEDRLPDLAAVLSGVRTCSARHFEAEEQAMLECGYPDVETHRELHREFARQLRRFEEAQRGEGTTARLAMEMGNWLAAWVREHQRYDLELGDHLRAAEARRAGSGPA